jgi:hypothetical protein
MQGGGVFASLFLLFGSGPFFGRAGLQKCLQILSRGVINMDIMTPAEHTVPFPPPLSRG